MKEKQENKKDHAIKKEVVQEKEQNDYGNNKPIIETQVMKSKDGRYLIHKTVITDIKPINYYKKVFD